jgi:hypothetical protein
MSQSTLLELKVFLACPKIERSTRGLCVQGFVAPAVASLVLFVNTLAVTIALARRLNPLARLLLALTNMCAH